MSVEPCPRCGGSDFWTFARCPNTIICRRCSADCAPHAFRRFVRELTALEMHEAGAPVEEIQASIGRLGYGRARPRPRMDDPLSVMTIATLLHGGRLHERIDRKSPPHIFGVQMVTYFGRVVRCPGKARRPYIAASVPA